MGAARTQSTIGFAARAPEGTPAPPQNTPRRHPEGVSQGGLLSSGPGPESGSGGAWEIPPKKVNQVRTSRKAGKVRAVHHALGAPIHRGPPTDDHNPWDSGGPTPIATPPLPVHPATPHSFCGFAYAEFLVSMVCSASFSLWQRVRSEISEGGKCLHAGVHAVEQVSFLRIDLLFFKQSLKFCRFCGLSYQSSSSLPVCKAMQYRLNCARGIIRLADVIVYLQWQHQSPEHTVSYSQVSPFQNEKTLTLCIWTLIRISW